MRWKRIQAHVVRILLAGLVVLGGTSLTAQAATRTVTTATDVMNPNDGVLSLREAITTALAGDTIRFDARLSGQTIRLTSGPLTLNKNLRIDGPGASQLTIHGNNTDRVLVITSGVNVTISKVTIAGGNAENLGEDGGGIHNSGTLTVASSTIRNNRAIFGGGIVNDGRLTVTDSVVNDNSADLGTGGGISNRGTAEVRRSTVSNNGAEQAGGIENFGTLILNQSTVSDNCACELGVGGGIYNSGTAEVTNSTISGNSGHLGGGGISNSGTLRLTSSTVTDNSGGSVPGFAFGPGGIASSGGTVWLTQTIVAGNTAQQGPADCAGHITSLGHNLVGAGTGCPRNGSGDLTVAPTAVFTTVLGPLQNNGGPTQTHALRSGSLTINAGGTGCPATDQLGVPRPQGPACDIGAVEFVVATSTTAWRHFPFAAQTGTFTALFEVVPQRRGMNGVTGLARGPVNSPTDLAVIVRFNPSGAIDVRHGSVYTADRLLPYTAGTRYYIRLVVQVARRTYSVYVRPQGGTEQVLATNYAFRTEQQGVLRLDTWALFAWTGSHTVRNFTVR